METISRFSIPGLLIIMLALIAIAWIRLRIEDAARGAICRICGLPLPSRPVTSEEPALCERGHFNP